MIAIVGPTCITIIHHYYRMFILDLRTSADVRPPCWSRFEAGMNHEPMSHHALTLKVSGQVLVLCCQVLLAGEGVLLILRVGGGGFPGDRVHHIPRHVLVSFSYQQLLTHTGLVQVVQEKELQSTDRSIQTGLYVQYQKYIYTDHIFFN